MDLVTDQIKDQKVQIYLFTNSLDMPTMLIQPTPCVEEILPYPRSSPDMAPSDFSLFQKLKSHLQGTQYGSNEGVIEAVNQYLGNQEKAGFKSPNRDGLSALP